MKSDNYILRFKAEYYQLRIRIRKLEDMLTKYHNNELTFTPICPFDILKDQVSSMKKYSSILEIRAEIENIWL
jgi:hypothetical protein